MVNSGRASVVAVPHESGTRERVLRLVSTDGPLSTPALAERLELTETAVRRHVDHLLADGLIEAREQAGPRRRGRPARVWVVSPAGHRALTSDYDHLAEQAVRFLRETGGEAAVHAFATARLADLEERYAVELAAAGAEPSGRAQALVDALTRDGYAASARPVSAPDGGELTGIQVCQGHCPVQHVAAEFPQFCEAETEAFSRLLGVHVQRLATLAHGDHVCTTFVPTPTTRKVPS